MALPSEDDLDYTPDDGSDDPVEQRRRTLADSGAAREFARCYLVLGMSCAKASRAVGWPSHKGQYLLRSAAWPALRQQIEADFDLTREQLFHEINDTLVTNAAAAARVQNAMLEGRVDELPPLKSDVLARVSDSAMDRVGLRAPAKVDHRVEVTLDAASLGRIEQALAQWRSVEATTIESHPLSYALTKPAIQQAEADDITTSDA